MAGLPIQVGDMIAMAKVAKIVIEYGWGKYSNAARQHDAFYRDVNDLYESLLALDDIIKGAGRELRQQLTAHSSQLRLRCDWRSLSEIIGDCKSTLDDCSELLARNKRFATSSGPLPNIHWNLFVQGDVDALRKRLRQHVEKIALAKDVLKLDLLGRIQEDVRRMHWDITLRIENLHEAFLGMQRDLQGASDVATRIPSTSSRPALPFTEPRIDIEIPVIAEHFFEAAFTTDDAPLGVPSLKDLSDAFLSSFYESTYRFQPGLDLQRQPPDDQYINLLRCIWVMNKIRSSEELTNAVGTDSHWPSYIEQLQKQLSSQCARFSTTWQGLERPRHLEFNGGNTRIWPQKLVTGKVLDQVVKEESMEEILRTKVNHGSEDSTVDLSVFRRIKSETESYKDADEFRICFSLGDGVPSLAGDLPSLDFNLKMATLVPAYAVDPEPRYRNSFIIETGPTAVSRISTRLDFLSPKGMGKFQHALTGYKVWGQKTLYANSVKFVYKSGPKGNNIVGLNACLQLWIPRRLEIESNQDSVSGLSSPSTDSAVSMTFGRRLSVLSKAESWAPSVAATMNTITSVGSTQTMVVPMEGSTPGFLHVRPDKPLLVLFTKHPATDERLMVTMEADSLDVNPKRCENCDRNDERSKRCPNIAIERDGGRQGDPLLGVKRFEAVNGHQQDWDVSRLAYEQRMGPDSGRKPWTDLTRLTIKFHNPEDRRKFSGEKCACKNRGKTETWAELQNCVKLGHRGFLGEVKMHYLSEVWKYDEWRKHRRQVVHRE